MEIIIVNVIYVLNMNQITTIIVNRWNQGE